VGFGACLVVVEEEKISYYPGLYFPKTYRVERLWVTWLQILFVVMNTYVMQGTPAKTKSVSCQNIPHHLRKSKILYLLYKTQIPASLIQYTVPQTSVTVRVSNEFHEIFRAQSLLFSISRLSFLRISFTSHNSTSYGKGAPITTAWSRGQVNFILWCIVCLASLVPVHMHQTKSA
jgi:hypothetical protein